MVQLLLLDSSLVEQLVAGLCLLNHHFHHHLHLIFGGLGAAHGSILEHLVHGLHLDFLLGLESFDGLLLGEGLCVVAAGSLSLLLHLHYLHSLSLVLSVEHGGLLELLLADAKLGEDLVQFVLHEHFLFLDHCAHDAFIL